MAKNTQIENPEILLSVGNRIKELRIKAGFASYEKFAIEFEIDRKQYWRAENGSNLTLLTLNKIATIHKLKMEEFFKGL